MTETYYSISEIHRQGLLKFLSIKSYVSYHAFIVKHIKAGNLQAGFASQRYMITKKDWNEFIKEFVNGANIEK